MIETVRPLRRARVGAVTLSALSVLLMLILWVAPAPAAQPALESFTTPLPLPADATPIAPNSYRFTMRQTTQQLVAPVVQHDRFRDHAPEARHALAEPRRHAAAVQGKIGAARPSTHRASAYVAATALSSAALGCGRLTRLDRARRRGTSRPQ